MKKEYSTINLNDTIRITNKILTFFYNSIKKIRYQRTKMEDLVWCIVESDHPIWAGSLERVEGVSRGEKRKEGRHGGRKWRYSSSYGNLHARTDVFFARKNASCSRTTGDGWWSVRMGNERCNCLRPRATWWCNELFCRMVEREEEAWKKKKYRKSLGSLEWGWECR